jgi:hypothetical protein
MAYRFDLRGTQVECDSAQELIAAIGSDCTPTTSKRRAQRQPRKKTKRGNQSRSWQVAKFYSEKPRVKMSVAEARSHLSSHPQVKARVEKEFAAANA